MNIYEDYRNYIDECDELIEMLKEKGASVYYAISDVLKVTEYIYNEYEKNQKLDEDLEEIFEYIENDLQSPEYSKGQTDRLWKSLKTREIFPSSHQERLVGNYAGKGYRQLLIDNYLAIFKIDEQRKIVKIITIQYQGRNL